MSEMKNVITINWNGGVEGNGILEGNKLKTNVAIPSELGGSGEGTDPKELLISSATSCFTLTLTSILENRKLPIEEFAVHTTSTTEDKQISIIHEAQITLSAEATQDDIKAAQRAVEGADQACMIGNLLKTAGLEIGFKANIIKK